MQVWQLDLTIRSKQERPAEWKVLLFNGFTVLSYANSMFNPVLYAFLSENFRKSFIKAFKCASQSDVNRTLYVETSTYPRHNNSNDRKYSREVTAYTETYQFTCGNTLSTTATKHDDGDHTMALYNGGNNDEEEEMCSETEVISGV